MTFLSWLLSLLYRAGLLFDRALKTFQQKTLPRPVISVGNLSVGGTGKTPLVIKLLADLKAWGFHAAVLARGYGSKEGFSDEAALLMKYQPDIPVAAAPDRARSAREILAKTNTDVFVLDDGFQHWKLHRNLDVVCIDATDPWAGGLLPMGRLREPKSALRRANLVVVTRTELVDDKDRRRLLTQIERYVDPERILLSAFKSTFSDWKSGRSLGTAELRGKRLLALSAIGRPQAFEQGLENAGARILPLRFRDHHHYLEGDLKKIEALAKKEKADVITTEKDLVKFERTRWAKSRELPFHLYVASVRHEFPPADESRWKKTILSVLKSK